jgi:hypothetical protein
VSISTRGRERSNPFGAGSVFSNPLLAQTRHQTSDFIPFNYPKMMESGALEVPTEGSGPVTPSHESSANGEANSGKSRRQLPNGQHDRLLTVF